jgi:hypothetical protein
MGMWKREQFMVTVAEDTPICPVCGSVAMMVYVIGNSPYRVMEGLPQTLDLIIMKLSSSLYAGQY